MSQMFELLSNLNGEDLSRSKANAYLWVNRINRMVKFKSYVQSHV